MNRMNSNCFSLDQRARAVARKRAIRQRPAAVAAARLEGHLSFQRLGYRTQGDYAREELGKSARTLRRMACLGRRLIALPRIRAAFESGELPLSKADCIARVATAETERAWLRMAARLPIKQLQSAVRQAGGACGAGGAVSVDGAASAGRRDGGAEPRGGCEEGRDAGAEPGDGCEVGDQKGRGALDEGGNGFPTPRGEASAVDDDSRSPMDVDVPGWMIGKAAAGLRLAGKVAGSSPPEGERWEYIAAEYLSGAPLGADGEDDGGPVDDQVRRASEEPAHDPPVSGRDHRSQTPRCYYDPPSPGRDYDPAAAGRDYHPAAPARDYHPAAHDHGHDPPAQTGDHQSFTSGSHGHLGKARTPEPVRRDDEREPEASQEQHGNDDSDALTPWELHKILKESYVPAGAIELELGALLLAIRSRGCWRELGFASFDDYVTERLALSPRTARRLIRLRFASRRHRVLAAALSKGVVSPLAATMLERVLDLDLDRPVAWAWIEYARRMPLQRLEDAIDWALACAAIDPAWARDHGRPPHPSFRFDGGVTGRCSGKRPKLAAAATSTLRLWLTRDERRVLERAVSMVRRARGPDWPLWACLNDLVDHFAEAYEDPAYARLRRRSPVLRRDDWQCQVPGCRARAGLHVHHVLARGVGGPNTFDNLLVVCDFHHLAIHRGWIGCWGKAPDRIRWSFGVARGSMWFTDLSYVPRGESERDWRRLPIAEFVGQYRLLPEEGFADVERRLFGEVTNVQRPPRRSRTDPEPKRSHAA